MVRERRHRGRVATHKALYSPTCLRAAVGDASCDELVYDGASKLE